jgi:hypothetical protein
MFDGFEELSELDNLMLVHAADEACHHLEFSGSFNPFAVIGARNGAVRLEQTIPEQAAVPAKAQFADLIRLVAQFIGAETVVFVTEGWRASPGHLGRPSDDPNRMEIVSVTLEVPTGQASLMFETCRDNDGEFDKLQLTSAAFVPRANMRLDVRFSNFLRGAVGTQSPAALPQVDDLQAPPAVGALASKEVH